MTSMTEALGVEVEVTPGRDALRLELEEERDFLLRSLDDLDAELAAADIDPGDHAVLRDDYTARAADTLRRIDALDGRPSAARVRAASSVSPRRRVPLIVGAVATTVLAVIAGVLLANASGERLPGDEATGQSPQAVASQRCAAAHDADQGGKATDALKLYDACIAGDPKNAEALAGEGWLLARVGRSSQKDELVAKGVAFLDRAIATDPTFAPALVWRGLGRSYLGRDADAICDLRAYLALAPADEPQNPQVESVLAAVTQRVGTAVPACAGPAITPVIEASTPAPIGPIAPPPAAAP